LEQEPFFLYPIPAALHMMHVKINVRNLDGKENVINDEPSRNKVERMKLTGQKYRPKRKHIKEQRL